MVELAQVIAVYPSRRKVDLAFLESGALVSNVTVMAAAASSVSGIWDVPEPPAPLSAAQAGGLPPSGLQLVAVVSKTKRGRPIVMGFIPPKGCVVTFNQQNRDIKLHPSGAYTTVAPDGSIEVWHPGGAYLRIGTGGHEDLSGIASNGWNPPSAPPPQITLVTSGFSLTAKPNGDLDIINTGSITVQSTAGDMTFEAQNINLVAEEALSLDCAALKGSIQGGAGTAEIQGGLKTTLDQVAGTISQQNHDHKYLPGSGAQTQTSAPVPGT